MKACTFFGHRNCDKTIDDKLYVTLEKLITNSDVKVFNVGTQGNFDKRVYIILEELKKNYDIKINVVLAYINRKATDEYYNKAYTVFPEKLDNTPPKFAISVRNDYMISNSDYLVCYLNDRFSNTYNLVLKAKKKNLQVINIGDLEI